MFVATPVIVNSPRRRRARVSTSAKSADGLCTMTFASSES